MLSPRLLGSKYQGNLPTKSSQELRCCATLRAPEECADRSNRSHGRGTFGDLLPALVHPAELFGLNPAHLRLLVIWDVRDLHLLGLLRGELLEVFGPSLLLLHLFGMLIVTMKVVDHMEVATHMFGWNHILRTRTGDSNGLAGAIECGKILILYSYLQTRVFCMCGKLVMS